MVVALAAALAGCGNQDSQNSTSADAAPAAVTSANDAKQANTEGDEAPVSSTEVADGSMDLQFPATNRSQAPVKSLMAEFIVTRASDGSVVESTATLVMPFEIPPSASKDV